MINRMRLVNQIIGKSRIPKRNFSSLLATSE